MKCGRHRRCVQLALIFHSTGGTANLFPSSIYGGKQDTNSGDGVIVPYAVALLCYENMGNLPSTY